MKQNNLAGIILSLIGLVLAIFPNALWKLTEKRKSRDASEPSALYRTTLRIVGAVFLIAGVLLAIGMLK